MCGDLRRTNAGETITLMGWVNRRRDHGNLIFLDLRDRSGITQVVLDKETSPLAHAKAEAARPEYVVAVTGKLRQRGPGLSNPNMPTGEVELVAHDLLLLNDAKTPPFPIADDGPITNEEIRLKYRYIDLRRPELQRNFELRHNITRAIRDYLSDNGFLEIETPLLTPPPPKARATTSSPAAFTPATSTPSRSPHRSSSSSSWSPASTATSRSPAASATKTSAPTASPTSPRSTSKSPSPRCPPSSPPPKASSTPPSPPPASPSQKPPSSR